MNVEITIPKDFLEKISKIGNKTKVKSALKIYNALYRKSKYKNKEGWFEVSSRYLRKINGRYNEILAFFIENEMIEPMKRIIKAGGIGGDLFTDVEKLTYSSFYSICKHYRFNPNINMENEDNLVMEIVIDNKSQDKRWYNVVKNTLQRLGYDGKISRDNFSGRIYHDLTTCYKEELSGKGYYVIDAVTSQPRLLYLIMKERGIVDTNYFNIFESNLDFYLQMKIQLGLQSREDAKEIFMYWALGNGYTKEAKMWSIFPEASKFLKKVKGRNYKDSSRYLAFRESSIWVDDLLQNIPTEFVVPIHDSFIVRGKDVNKVLTYCQDKYPDLRFDLKEL